MSWVRIHPLLANWPGGTDSPPVFDISSDENGTAVVELAFDPQTLLAPASYSNPLRYYGSDVPFDAKTVDDNGSSRAVSLPAQTITLSGTRATWSIPAPLWAAYVQESLKSLGTRSATTFSRNLYYRVRVTPAGASSATVYPDDATLTGPSSAAAPHISILPISATLSSQVVPDQAAVQAMGGLPLVAPKLWGDMLLWLWKSLPEQDAGRRALAAVFAHKVFQDADLATRAAVLKLWLVAGPSGRLRLPELLDRNAVTGTNVVQPIITKRDLRGGKTLVELLLDLLWITPHPDLLVRTATGTPPLNVKESLLNDVIREILDPNGQVNQGAAGTCAPTTMQTLLITVNPAEYARLQLGLLSAADGTVLADGSTVTVPPAIFQAARYASGINGQAFLFRTNAELAFQATLVRHAQGSRFPAFTGTPDNVNKIFQATIEAGLSADEIERGLEGLFGVGFTGHVCAWPAQPGQVTAADQLAARDGLLADLPARQQQLVLATAWGQPPKHGGHAVLCVRRDQPTGRVFFKNPQYPGSAPPSGIAKGASTTNPPRRWEDPTQAIESITEADLASWIYAYWTPDSALI
jgi:hypothetical protein